MPETPVSVALVSTHGVAALRAALHRLHDSIPGDAEVVVLAAQHRDDVLDYLSRQYLRGEVAAVALEAREPEMAHCGIDTAFPMASGEIIVRVQDDLAFAPGWLDRVGEALRTAPDIGLLGLVREHEPRRRGRPPKTRSPEPVDEVDLRAFAASADVLRLHAAALAGERCAAGCRFQELLRRRGYRLAYLAGQVAAATPESVASTGAELEADLAFHPGAREAMARLRQSYALGDVVLTPCGVCDEDELEVLGVQIDFCATHDVAIGHTYTMRCPGCHVVRLEEDHEFRCPA